MTKKELSLIMGSMVDRSVWRWWDRTLAVAGVPEICFFTIPVNGVNPLTGRLKTFRETNMLQSGQLAAPYSSIIAQVGFEILSSDAVVDEFYNACWMEFFILHKVFLRGPLWRFRAGNGYQPVDVGFKLPDAHAVPEEYRELYDTTLAELDRTLGYFSDCRTLSGPQAGYRLKELARYLPPLCQFGLKLYFPAGIPRCCNGLEVCAYLDGLTDIPIQ